MSESPFILASIKIFGSAFTALFVAFIKKAKNDYANKMIIQHIKDEFQRSPGPAHQLYGSIKNLKKFINHNPRKFPEINLWDEIFLNPPHFNYFDISELDR